MPPKNRSRWEGTYYISSMSDNYLKLPLRGTKKEEVTILKQLSMWTSKKNTNLFILLGQITVLAWWRSELTDGRLRNNKLTWWCFQEPKVILLFNMQNYKEGLQSKISLLTKNACVIRFESTSKQNNWRS